MILSSTSGTSEDEKASAFYVMMLKAAIGQPQRFHTLSEDQSSSRLAANDG